ncbi:prolyl oligopeptidase family serine peptidase [Aquincola sp. MAHUQ-54]|uniref:Prolyl oligopeptidase family serine peptidase n=1 Tax=Aquincola agrisoli TaxID=3119538 RepID=A0AAW9Q7T5_9BURK
MRRSLALLLSCLTFLSPVTAQTPPEDPYLWLEDVQGEQALAWVRERNAVARRQLEGDERFAPMRDRLREILDSKARIPAVARRGDALYNFWRDENHPRGLWRRTTLAEYRRAEPAWETVLDLDKLAADEGENWVWAGATCLGPDYRRCLLSLSRGGADATVTREFDSVDKRFVDGGFVLPEAKSRLEWIDEDTLYVASDFGPGSLTDSGYPRVIKRWRRGQPLAEARTVFEGERGDVSVSVSVDRTPGYERTVFSRATDFYNSLEFLLEQAAGEDRLLPIDKPTDATLSFWREKLLVELRSDLRAGDTLFPRGSLLVTDAAAYLDPKGRDARCYTSLFAPTPTRSLAGYATTATRLVLTVSDNVASRLEELRPAEGGWERRPVDAPYPGTLGVSTLHDPLLPKDPLGEHYLLSAVDFLTPDTLSLGQAGTDERETLKSSPRFFDAAGMRVEQRFAKSKDGTRVPYFVVWPKGAVADGDNPTLLYGYGGFEVPLQPWYAAASGNVWGAHGGVFVVANIRGGGEFGPGWHQAAIKADKQKSYDDFIAVAEDLVANKVTRPARLGIQGGSNGGLLVGAVMLQRPELFNAVLCQVPLLDMKRYHLLLAGASWMGEYGNPDDPADWAVISRYSPYQVLAGLAPGTALPPVLFTTSTRDDRVHPGHARKMAARMMALGHATLYYENIEGGHGGAADNAQRAEMMALGYVFLWQQLGRAPAHATKAAP